MISIVTPAYREEKNLPLLYERLVHVLSHQEMEWEWIVVDDHSDDRTFAVMQGLAARDPHVRSVRFSRNFGSHAAITCGLELAQGDCAVVLAADLQDPPEIIPQLLEPWRAGAKTVWAVRMRREGESLATRAFARLYYMIMRHVAGLREIPSTGADFFLLDRQAINAFCQFRESNMSILVLIAWMGFSQANVYYDKQARLHGESGWSLKKKLKLVVDSVIAFTYAPIRLISYIGVAIATLGFLYAAVVVVNALVGHPVTGWASLMVAVLIIGGTIMLMLGVLGEYLWRSLDESRGRPRYIVEEATSGEQERMLQIESRSAPVMN